MKPDKIIALLLLAFTAVWSYFTFKLPASTMPGEPGPKMYPSIILVLLGIFSILLLVGKEKKEEPEVSEEDLKKMEELGMEVEKKEVFQISQAMILFGLFLVGLVIMYFFGYIIGMTIGLIAMLRYVGWKVFPKALLVSTIVTVFIYVLFNVLLHVPLPTGTLL
ncbi:MAG: tripartite tricarboxylate transporter TctB family protein [Desulfitobacterium hafniense]|nr:tripartite tricarboxylate transporter TctB family protein [Desulfitobacterium hafniense]